MIAGSSFLATTEPWNVWEWKPIKKKCLIFEMIRDEEHGRRLKITWLSLKTLKEEVNWILTGESRFVPVQNELLDGLNYKRNTFGFDLWFFTSWSKTWMTSYAHKDNHFLVSSIHLTGVARQHADWTAWSVNRCVSDRSLWNVLSSWKETFIRKWTASLSNATDQHFLLMLNYKSMFTNAK